MAITCTRRLTFCAGHRVMGHENKCAHLHGHNYVVEVTAESSGLDSIGRVIDFSVLKDRIGGWIEKHWDHGFILDVKDSKAISAIGGFEPAGYKQKIHLLLENPTAENIASHLLRNVCPKELKGTGVRVVRVVIRETENCYAEAVHDQ